MSEVLCGNASLDLEQPQVMGVLNITPDSFSDGGELLDARGQPCRDVILERAAAMARDGAALLDIGGESTRPGARKVSEAEEMDRVLPVVEWLGELDVLISVDTTKPGVMREACASGAHLINDVNACRAAGALEVLKENTAGICLMHMQGEPATMQRRPRYDDVVAEVAGFLAERLNALEEAGISRERCLVDPGIGFGKTLEHNLALLAGLPALTALGVPVMVGVSRKSMIGTLTGKDAKGRVHASIAAALYAVMRGASILRVHDVAETCDALKVWRAIGARDVHA